MGVTAKDTSAQVATVAEAEAAVYGYRWMILLVCWLAYLAVYLQRLAIGPLAPFLREDLGISSAQVGAFVSAATLGYMVTVLPGGVMVDRIGVRWVSGIGQLASGLFILGMLLVRSFNAGLLVMAITGLGTGLVTPATTKAVLLWFPARERATVMGLKQTAVNAGGIICAVTLPVLALSWGWRYGFVVIGLLSIAMGIVSLVLYREPAAGSRVTATAPSLAGGLIRIIRGRDIWLLILAGTALVAVEFSALTHFVLYFNKGLAISVVAAGGFLALTHAGGALGKPFSGLISDRVFRGKRKVAYALMAAVSAVCIAAISMLPGGGGIMWVVWPISFVLGLAALGWGGLHLTMVSEIAGRELAATVTAFTGVFLMIGVVVGPPLFGYIVDAWGSYRLAWQFLVICSIISAVAVMFVREERRRL